MNTLTRLTLPLPARALRGRSSRAALCFALALTEPVQGANAPVVAESTGAPRVVRVLLVGEVGQESALPERIASWFPSSRFSVGVRAVGRLDSARILAPVGSGELEVWVTLRGPSAHLYFVVAGGGGAAPTYLVRELSLPRGLDEMGAERLAEVLHLSALALLEGRAESERDDVEQDLRAESPPPVPPVAVEPRRGTLPLPEAKAVRHAWRLRPLLGYAAGARGDEGVAHGPRVGAFLSVTPVFALKVAAEVAFPRTRELAGVTVRFDGAQLMLAPVLRRSLSDSLRGEIWLGPVLEALRFRPRTAGTMSVAGDAGTDVRAGGEAGAGLVIEGEAVSLALSVHAALVGPGSDYNWVVDGVRRRAAESPLLAPRVGAELRF